MRIFLQKIKEEYLASQLLDIPGSFAEAFAYYIMQWENLITRIVASLKEDPRGETGKQIAYAWAQLAKESGDKDPVLKRALLEAYRGAKIPNTPFNKEVLDWLEIALKIVNHEPHPLGLKTADSF